VIPSDIKNAIGQHLSAGIARPIVWQDKATTLPPRPYLVMQNGNQSDISNTLNGEKRSTEGRVVIIIVGDLNAFATPAVDLAAAVKARFPKALRLGGVTIARSQVLPGYPTDTDWRIPVEVSWTINRHAPSSRQLDGSARTCIGQLAEA
jgi:hypothetical protein